MSSVPPLIFIALLGAAVAAGDEAPRQPVGVSVSLGRATIWQRAPAQDTGLTILGVSCDLEGTLAVFALFGLVDNRTEGEARAWGVANPSLGMTLEMPVARRLDLGLIFGSTVPVGSGGGDFPSRPIVLRAMLSGTDWGGPMFGPNHIDVYEGLRLTSSEGGFTFRFRSTLHPAVRVRGNKTDSLGPRVIFTSSGLLAAYAVTPQLSFFTELAETRFLNHPPFLQDDPSLATDRYAVAGLGLDLERRRLTHVKPSLLYARAVDAPKNRRHFHLIEMNVRVSF